MASALFLDRDGVVIQQKGYIRDAALVELVPGMTSLIRYVRALGMRVILVTNQSGIGRGWVAHEEYIEVSRRMLDLLREEGAFLDHLFYAPFYNDSPAEKKLHALDYSSFHVTPDGKLQNEGHWHESWRKPCLGMVEEAQRQYDLDIAASFMIGDRLSDLELAGRAGMKKAFLIKAPVFRAEMTAERQERWELLLATYGKTQFQIVTALTDIQQSDFE